MAMDNGVEIVWGSKGMLGGGVTAGEIGTTVIA